MIVGELGYNIGYGSYGWGPVTTKPKDGIKASRLSIFSSDGEVLSRWGTDDYRAPGSFKAPHAVCVDSKGSIYVGEVVISQAEKVGDVPRDCHALQKFMKLPQD